MDVTLTLNEAIWLLVAILLAVLIVFVIVLVARLNKTVKGIDIVVTDAKEITGDVKVVTKSVSEKVQKVDSIVNGACDAMNEFVTSVNGSKGLIKTIGSVANACTSLIGLSKNKQK